MKVIKKCLAAVRCRKEKIFLPYIAVTRVYMLAVNQVKTVHAFCVGCFFCAQYKQLAYGYEGLYGLCGNFYPHRGLKRPYIFLYNKITLNYEI